MRALFVLFAVLLALPAHAADVGKSSGLALPRYVTLKAAQANVRTGPGTQYPIRWVYTRKFLPVEIVDEFDHWRKIRDNEGGEGWINKNLLAGGRSVIVRDKTRALLDSPSFGARVTAMVEAGVIALLKECRDDWCYLDIEGTRGWMPRNQLWGVYPDEVIKDD